MAKVILKAAMALFLSSAGVESVEIRIAHKHFELRCRAISEGATCKIDMGKQDGQY